MRNSFGLSPNELDAVASGKSKLDITRFDAAIVDGVNDEVKFITQPDNKPVLEISVFETGYLEMRCSKSCYWCDLELVDLFDNASYRTGLIQRILQLAF